ncbi:hypothetical protein H6F47_11465 [Sphaerospermopsis sp. FACHB-1094]|uniref:hypothetical protein n=1 Tax=Sphaerospermopsis sp. FACHB-1094 TaxID=2692861 RepID=UPI0016849CA9|nr:hypothetical protein [Sphaerospermopsis sp. FACHB-1094]MBD2133031.1 hypothetical protein [Sphaerospermopsis sp. FACHB-1094]
MNLYFLVEGKRTENKVYPAWLKHLLPELQQVKNFDEVDKNNFYLFSANGYPSIIYDHLPNAILDIQENGKYNYLVLCLDAEENTVSEIKQEIYDFLKREKPDMDNIEMVIIIQNRCLETWFLGNRKIYTRNPQDKPLLEYTRYYDVSIDCPELMGQYQNFNTHAKFHEAYLKELFRVKNIYYSKRNPGDVVKQFYLQQLIDRIKSENTHLPTFQTFIEFCSLIRLKLLQ